MIVVTSQYTIEEVFGYDSKAFDAISRRFWEFRWDGQRFVGVQDLEDAFPTASSEAVALAPLPHQPPGRRIGRRAG